MSETQPVDVDQLRSEVASLQRQLESERRARSARVRGVTGWVLTVLAVLATTLALLAVWTFRTFTDTELFVDRVGSIIEQPEVAAAVGDAAATRLVTALDLEERVAGALPDEIAVVAGPLTTAAENYLSQGAAALVQTDAFEEAWDASLTAGHKVSIGILSGTDTTAVENSNGVIVLDVTPVVNAILAEGADFLSGLLNRDISAPTVTGDDIDAGVAAIEQQLGTDLPADFGQVVLFESESLATAQAAYQGARAAVWLAPIAALLLAGLAIAVSTRRVRTALSIVIGTALALLAVAVLLEPIESTVVSSVVEQGLSGAVGAAFTTILSSLVNGIVVMVVLGILAACVLVLTGNSRVGVSGRSTLASMPSLAGRYRGWFLGGGAVVAVALLAVIPGRSWGQVLAVLGLYALYGLAVVLAPRPAEE